MMETIHEETPGRRISERVSSEDHGAEGHVCRGDRTATIIQDQGDEIDGHRMAPGAAAHTTTDGLRVSRHSFIIFQ